MESSPTNFIQPEGLGGYKAGRTEHDFILIDAFQEVSYFYKRSSKWKCILSTDPSCQTRFILTVHYISCDVKMF